MTYRVFVSHGWSDLWVAQQIERRARRDAKATTFIDAFDIEKGDDFEERIFGEIDRTDELVVLLTPWSVDRNWLWVEIGAARLKGCRIVPVLYGVLSTRSTRNVVVPPPSVQGMSSTSTGLKTT